MIETGIESTMSYPITADMSPKHLEPVTVLGTSSVVELMEQTALQSVEAMIPVDRTTVGTRIEVHHRNAAFPGEVLEVSSRLIGCGRRLEFEIVAAVGDRTIATAIHQRAIVDPARFGR